MVLVEETSCDEPIGIMVQTVQVVVAVIAHAQLHCGQGSLCLPFKFLDGLAVHQSVREPGFDIIKC